jgi:hypothetical protein
MQLLDDKICKEIENYLIHSVLETKFLIMDLCRLRTAYLQMLEIEDEFVPWHEVFRDLITKYMCPEIWEAEKPKSWAEYLANREHSDFKPILRRSHGGM